MSEKEAIEIIKGLHIQEYEWYENTKQIKGHEEEEAKKVRQAIDTIINLIEKQQEEIEDLEERNRIKNSLNGAKMSKFLINIGRKVGITEIAISESMILEAIDNKFVSKNKIIERIKELEEQQETLKYDGNVCFADYEQFCKNLKFLKEQTKELLEEN